MASAELVALGVVMGAHGVRGELRVKPHNEQSALWGEVERVVARAKGQPERACDVESVRRGSKGLIVALAQVTRLDDARALLGAELCVPRSVLPELLPGEYYFVDLPGLRVQTRDGALVGTVARVLEYPASRVLVVDAAGGSLEVPMVAPYLVAVDVPAGHVVVDELSDLEILGARR